MHAHRQVETNYLCMESARIFEANVMAEKVEIYRVTTAVFSVLAVVLKIPFTRGVHKVGENLVYINEISA